MKVRATILSSCWRHVNTDSYFRHCISHLSLSVFISSSIATHLPLLYLHFPPLALFLSNSHRNFCYWLVSLHSLVSPLFSSFSSSYAFLFSLAIRFQIHCYSNILDSSFRSDVEVFTNSSPLTVFILFLFVAVLHILLYSTAIFMPTALLILLGACHISARGLAA